MEAKITLDTEIEELVARYPQAVGFLTKKGLRCIRCGEPVWGTLEEFLEEEKIKNPQHLVDELNRYIEEKRKETESKK
ncbi:MAG: DUF1858 domain-containing protein [Candidatus Aminicenantes bacterium]